MKLSLFSTLNSQLYSRHDHGNLLRSFITKIFFHKQQVFYDLQVVNDQQAETFELNLQKSLTSGHSDILLHLYIINFP